MTVGQPVEITFTNRDRVEHDFSVMEFPLANGTPVTAGSPVPGHDMGGMSGMDAVPALHMAAGTGMIITLKYTPSTPGTYTFYCTVPGHKEAGMVGSLVVKAP